MSTPLDKLWREVKQLAGLPNASALERMVGLYHTWPDRQDRDQRLLPHIARILEHWPALPLPETARQWAQEAPSEWLRTPPFHALRLASHAGAQEHQLDLALGEPLSRRARLNLTALELALIDNIFWDDAQLEAVAAANNLPLPEVAKRFRDEYARLIDEVFPQEPDDVAVDEVAVAVAHSRHPSQ